ncbi:transposase [Fonticella tunisiensis]|uniref:Transposase-like protein DUF772 n=1 Tax=Fonticella tunisiensis TaxID=1096341 RepID=A0A4R7KAM6_9CLOT|nr:transposase [Fonticella tunisiensis]TDT51923.1 transposase-like protein DUF772 [Fonticella tunisiensis]
MYIRQETFLSFEEIIKYQPKTKIQMVLSQLDLTVLETNLSKSDHERGPKDYEASKLFYALIAMQLKKIKNIHGLVERLNPDPALRYYCGFDVLKKAPSEPTFSRFLDKISSIDYL